MFIYSVYVVFIMCSCYLLCCRDYDCYVVVYHDCKVVFDHACICVLCGCCNDVYVACVNAFMLFCYMLKLPLLSFCSYNSLFKL